MLSALRRAGVALSVLTERWVPDSWVVCMILTALALALALLGAGASPHEALLAWGGGVWSLLALAMQFTLAMVAAHACVTSRPVFALFDRIARLPHPEKPLQAVLVAGLFSLVTGYVNWALCLVACALLVPFVCRNNPRADLRVVIAAAYLGLGTVWHGGLSGSAPLVLATPGNPLLEPKGGAPIVDRLYPVTETLFGPYNLAYVIGISAIALAVVLALHPRGEVQSFSKEQLDRIQPRPPEDIAAPETPAGRIDDCRGFVWLAAWLLAYPLGHSLWTRGFGASWTIDAYNSVFLIVALVLHGRPLAFLRACRAGIDSAWGIVLQFPFYAGIFGLMQNTGLGAWLGSVFVEISTRETYPFIVYVYSASLNLFVPSGGSKWLIEAPYLIPAGAQLGVSPVTVLLAYSYGDSTTNLIHPFFAIPLLAVTRIRFGEVIGFTLIVAAICGAVTGAYMFVLPPDL